MTRITNIRSCRIVIAAAAAVVVATPAVAHARTSATCTLSDGSARCAGTIADRTLSPAPTQGGLVINGERATVFVDTTPLVSIFTPDLTTNAELLCVPAASLVSCSGTGQAGPALVSVHATATRDGSNALIDLADAASTGQPATRSQTSPAPAGQQTTQPARHHTRSRHRRRSRRHTRPRHSGHGCRQSNKRKTASR